MSAPADAEPSPEPVLQAPGIGGDQVGAGIDDGRPDNARPDGATVAQRFAQASQQPAADSGPQSVGLVSSLQGTATVVRNGTSAALKLQDEIFKGDVLKTGPGATLGIIFDDETTFSLTANASIAVDDFVYEEGGGNNLARFQFVQGTVAFVAHAVAKTGDMTLSTPTATMGIRGTTGLVNVGAGGTTAGTDAIKLYPDADGKVGRIEVKGRDGTALGVLTRPATGLSLQRGGRRRRARACDTAHGIAAGGCARSASRSASARGTPARPRPGGATARRAARRRDTAEWATCWAEAEHACSAAAGARSCAQAARGSSIPKAACRGSVPKAAWSGTTAKAPRGGPPAKAAGHRAGSKAVRGAAATTSGPTAACAEA